MARLQRRWGVQARWKTTPGRGENPWWAPTWHASRAEAERNLADVEGSAGLEARLVSQIVGDVEVVPRGQASA